jgi:hypothetical protein
VSGSATSVTVTFSSDDQEAITPAAFINAIISFVCVPNWSTSWYIGSTSPTSVVIQFGTAAPSGGASLFWTAIGS